MRTLVITGLLASAATFTAAAPAAAQASDSVAPGLSIAAGGQRAATMSTSHGGGMHGGSHGGGMHGGGHGGGHGWSGGHSSSTSNSVSNSRSISRSNSVSNSRSSSRSISRNNIHVGGSRSISRSGGSRSISRSGGSTTNVHVSGGNHSGGGNWNGGHHGGGSWGGGHQGGGNWHGGGGSWGGGNWNGGGHFNRGTRFIVGGFLPTFFLAPRYYLTDYPAYGLGQPRSGYRWVRYYDDAYMVDDRGYVADYRYGVPYDDGGYYADGRYDDGYYGDDHYGDRSSDGYGASYYCEPRRGGGGTGAAVGAVAGGVLGGVAGNLIAGRGDRTEGTIIGAGLGAVAGGVAGAAAERSRDRDDCYAGDGYAREDVEYRYDDRVPDYVGEGEYYPEGEDCDCYREERVGYDFDHSPQPAYRRPPPQPAYRQTYQQPVRTEVYVSGGVPRITTQATGGIAQNATTTIVLGNSAPATTTTTVVEEEYEYATPQRHYRSKRLRR